jgi:hypothetical protein
MHIYLCTIELKACLVTTSEDLMNARLLFSFFLYERLLLLLICTWKNAIELLLHISRAQKKN